MYESIPETGFLRVTQVLRLFPISKSGWYAGVKSGKYPKPVRLSDNIVAWKVEDIKRLIAEKSGAAA